MEALYALLFWMIGGLFFIILESKNKDTAYSELDWEMIIGSMIIGVFFSAGFYIANRISNQGE